MVFNSRLLLYSTLLLLIAVDMILVVSANGKDPKLANLFPAQFWGEGRRENLVNGFSRGTRNAAVPIFDSGLTPVLPPAQVNHNNKQLIQHILKQIKRTPNGNQQHIHDGGNPHVSAISSTFNSNELPGVLNFASQSDLLQRVNNVLSNARENSLVISSSGSGGGPRPTGGVPNQLQSSVLNHLGQQPPVQQPSVPAQPYGLSPAEQARLFNAFTGRQSGANANGAFGSNAGPTFQHIPASSSGLQPAPLPPQQIGLASNPSANGLQLPNGLSLATLNAHLPSDPGQRAALFDLVKKLNGRQAIPPEWASFLKQSGLLNGQPAPQTPPPSPFLGAVGAPLPAAVTNAQQANALNVAAQPAAVTQPVVASGNPSQYVGGNEFFAVPVGSSPQQYHRVANIDYGTYVGSMQETASADPNQRRYNCHGGLWAVDPHTLLVSSFTFQPSFLETENITFFVGPKMPTSNGVDDMFPSENGIYLKPEKLDVSKIVSDEPPEIIYTKLPDQKDISQIDFLGRTTSEASKTVQSLDFESKQKEGAEAEPNTEGEPSPKRFRRSAFLTPRWQSEDEQYLYGDQSAGLGSRPDRITLSNSRVQGDLSASNSVVYRRPSTSNGVRLIVDGGMVEISPTGTPVFNPNHQVVSDQQEGNSVVTEQQLSYIPPLPPRPINFGGTSTTTPATTTTGTEVSIPMEPLTWFAGFEPLRLKLPKGRRVDEMHWLAVWDHEKKTAIASVLIPNGPGFKVPGPVFIRPLQSIGLREIRSGPIEIVDTKTIRIHDFFFEGDAPGAWFMVGKQVLPNPLGTIVPVLRDHDQKYDCDYLQPYYTQTITLKLPGKMQIKDVFWLSVFCVPYAISFAAVYLPYNDIVVPTDMSGIQVPTCQLQR